MFHDCFTLSVARMEKYESDILNQSSLSIFYVITVEEES